ncbi:MAG: RDD family protein [Ignavibacteria bacterium]|nr:RDD family protein [Ignavibacteria bacterium]
MDQPLRYARFWLRFAAWLIDALLLAVVELMILLPFIGLLGITVFEGEIDESPVVLLALAGAFAFGAIAIFLLGWIYYAVMESSANQGTLGKMVVGLKVTDLAGNRVTFGKATGRYFGKIFSGLLLSFGYIMAAFTQQKQALHDILAGTLVVEK